MKILIAEDDMDLSHLAETFLLDCGHEVIKAVDTSQVLPSARREKPDFILLDINMLGGKGGDILVKLKRSSLTSNIRVIVVSGVTDPQILTFVEKEGAEGFLPKPWAPENFIQEL